MVMLCPKCNNSVYDECKVVMYVQLSVFKVVVFYSF